MQCDGVRIGELAARAGASPRQVRFYEAKGLITSTRGPNNYRDYSEAARAVFCRSANCWTPDCRRSSSERSCPAWNHRATRSSSKASQSKRLPRSNKSVTD
ncbi:MerR family DNA-binding transcriptional regulator [Streptomyces sp. S1D4-11]